jgi:cytochrome c oxidase subunit 2
MRPAVLILAVVSAGCSGPQSALAPAGRDAERIADLFFWMAGAAFVVWAIVVGLALYATRPRVPSRNPKTAVRLIIGGGVVLPTVALAALLAYGLALMPAVLAPGPADGLRIEVSGERWWWRVRYLPPGDQAGQPAIELANEIRLPVGERVTVELVSPDVIHSFWIPALAGKVDMIPGRVTRIALEPTRTGIFRGACAEYCGTSHAFMNFATVVVERAAFDDWLAAQARPAAAPAGDVAERGLRAFLANGCGACHAIRGTPADGVVGPDLTHVGSRLTLGAGMFENRLDTMIRWIAEADRLKPDAHMPAFGMLPAEEVAAMAAYLERLE